MKGLLTPKIALMEHRSKR